MSMGVEDVIGDGLAGATEREGDLRFDGNLTAANVVEAYRHMVFRMATARLLYGFVFVTFALAVMRWVSTGHIDAALAIGAVVTSLVMPLSIAGSVRRHLASLGPAREFSASIGPRGIHVHKAKESIAYGWSAIGGVFDRPNQIIFDISHVGTESIPICARIMNGVDGSGAPHPPSVGESVTALWLANRQAPADRWVSGRFVAHSTSQNADTFGITYRVDADDMIALDRATKSPHYVTARRSAIGIVMAALVADLPMVVKEWERQIHLPRHGALVVTLSVVMAQLILILPIVLMGIWLVKGFPKLLYSNLVKHAVWRDRTVCVDADGLQERIGDRLEIHVPWSTVADVTEDGDRIYVSLGNVRRGVVIPRRAFASPADAQTFARTIRTLWRPSATATADASANPW
jgi:hypothetical protein